MMRLSLSVVFLFLAIVSAGGYSIEVEEGSLHGSVGSLLDDALSVTVLDSVGRPVQDVQVDFMVSSTEGSIAAPFTGIGPMILQGDSVSGDIDGLRILTGSDGVASVSLKLGDDMGNNTVHAVAFLPDRAELTADFSVLAIDLKEIIFQVIGGLAIFLLGMRMMSDSLQRVAGNRMRSILKKMTDNRILGLMAGALVTAVIQSSSATSVIAVSFVNSGLMVLRQAVGVIIGANIGTTITGQLIAFKVMAYSFPMIAIGFAMLAFSRNKKTQFWGRALVGLGLIFLGMNLMKGVLTPLKSSQAVRDFFTNFSSNPMLAILAGTLLTAIIQSSSATVGLTMTLAGAGLISLQGAVYLVLGDNIGTTVTAQLSAIGGGRAARQTAMAHTLFNVLGAVWMGLLVADPNGFVLNLFRSTSGNALRQVANAHSAFNLMNALVFLPLVPLLTRICKLIVPDRKEDVSKEIVLQLDDNLLDSPSLAMDNLERELVKMADYAGATVSMAERYFFSGSTRPDKILSMEDRVDYMQRDMTVYASKLFQRDLDRELSLKLPVIIHSINDLERVSDHAVNMVEARDRIKGDVRQLSGFLPEAAVEAGALVEEMFREVVNALATHDRKASRAVLSLEERINSLEERARVHYTESFNCQSSSNGDMTGLVLLDFIDYCERIGDHLTNVAQSLLGGGFWHGTDDIE